MTKVFPGTAARAALASARRAAKLPARRDRRAAWVSGFVAGPAWPGAAAYFVAPIVSPRTMWRATSSANTVTGRTIIVPVAMILPHGNS